MMQPSVTEWKSNKAGRRPNVVLVVLDAMRADHLGLYGYDRKTDEAIEPYLNHMAVFKNAYPYSLITPRSVPAIMCSIWPDLLETKGWENLKQTRLPSFCCTLAEVFQSAGYCTIAHTCWAYYLTDRQGFGRGFEDFFGFIRQDKHTPDRSWKSMVSALCRHVQYYLRFIPSPRAVKFLESRFHWLRETANKTLGLRIEEAPGTCGRSAEAVTDYVFQGISKHRDAPFFAWAHYLDAHFPFSPPEPFLYGPPMDALLKREITRAIYDQKPISDSLMKALNDLFDAEVRSAFHEVGRIFEFLRDSNLLEQTCVVIVGDHGQGLWEHGYWECPDDMFYDESVRVPLLIYDSRLVQGLTYVKEPVSLINLAPTLLDMCGIPDEDSFFGESFAGLLRDGVAPEQKAVWIETVGSSRHCCYVRDGKKTVYDLGRNRLLYVLDSDDNLIPETQIDSSTFFADLQAYAERKRQFLKQLAVGGRPGGRDTLAIKRGRKRKK